MSEQPEPSRVQRLEKALEESRRVEKELDSRDVQKDAQFADRLAERLGRPDSDGA